MRNSSPGAAPLVLENQVGTGVCTSCKALPCPPPRESSIGQVHRLGGLRSLSPHVGHLCYQEPGSGACHQLSSVSCSSVPPITSTQSAGLNHRHHSGRKSLHEHSTQPSSLFWYWSGPRRAMDMLSNHRPSGGGVGSAVGVWCFLIAMMLVTETAQQ